MTAVQVCSTSFLGMGRAQARGLGYADLPIAVMPHPFGTLTRDGVRTLAVSLVADIASLACKSTDAVAAGTPAQTECAALVDVGADADDVNALFRAQGWTDGLPVVAPTQKRVQRMLEATTRHPDEIVARLPPGFGAATVQRIAINAVMAGCDPACMPVLIAAVEAVTPPEFNVQTIQTTTNPATVWLIVNGPIAQDLGMNGNLNCLGQTNWANATLGRALHLILLNIGRAVPGELDRATHGQPGKYTFCCAENETETPWEPLHVEKGYRADQSTVTVVGAEGTLNMNTHTKNADEILNVIAATLPRPPSNDYLNGGNPWIVLSPEHAHILHAAGLTKAQVKSRLWEQSKMSVRLLPPIDFARIQSVRGPELGTFTQDTLLPIATTPDNIGILVAGGPGTHSTYVPSLGSTRSVTRVILP